MHSVDYKRRIEWHTTTGCSKISPGCENCIALKGKKSTRINADGSIAVETDVVLNPDALRLPYVTNETRIFEVSPMGDLFHEKVPLDFIKDVFKVMNENPMHKFLLLTKWSELLLKYSPDLTWTKNIWAGVSVEDANCIYRIEHLKETDAKVKVIAFEPLIGAAGMLDLDDISWVIVGGERAAVYREMQVEWASDIAYQCKEANVPMFFKGYSGPKSIKILRALHRKYYNGMPG
jgi:protein gp37